VARPQNIESPLFHLCALQAGQIGVLQAARIRSTLNQRGCFVILEAFATANDEEPVLVEGESAVAQISPPDCGRHVQDDKRRRSQ
jgi:hypothetical protein